MGAQSTKVTPSTNVRNAIYNDYKSMDIDKLREIRMKLVNEQDEVEKLEGVPSPNIRQKIHVIDFILNERTINPSLAPSTPSVGGRRRTVRKSKAKAKAKRKAKSR